MDDSEGKQVIINASAHQKGREAARRTSANKRKAMIAGVAKRDWRRLKQVPNAQRRHRITAENQKYQEAKNGAIRS